jgi:hypothetical protein
VSHGFDRMGLITYPASVGMPTLCLKQHLKQAPKMWR